MVLLVTVPAILHFDLEKLRLWRRVECRHVTVTKLAIEFAYCDMPAMRKINVVRDVIDIVPRNLFVLADIFVYQQFLRRLLHRRRVACSAHFYVRDAGARTKHDVLVTGHTGDFEFPGMNSVAEIYRLREGLFSFHRRVHHDNSRRKAYRNRK